MRNSLHRKWASCAILLGCLALPLCGVSPQVQAATYTTIAPPGARWTVPAAINRDGVIAGYYYGGAFVRSPDGTYSTFNFPNTYATYVTGLNDKGSVVGWYIDANLKADHAFIRKANGHISTIDLGNGNHTHIWAIDRFGDTCGDFKDAQGNEHGFVRTPDGTITTFDPAGSIATFSMGINSSGAIAGFFYDGHNDHGFVRAPDGTITVFDPPRSILTVVFGINDKGAIVGGEDTDDFRTSDFVRDVAGQFTLFDPSAGDVYTDDTTGAGITNNGTVAGWYYFETDTGSRGFVRQPDGKLQVFNAPGKGRYTFVSGANDAGAIVGHTESVGQNGQGFLRTP
jgi:hypothetical protein